MNLINNTNSIQRNVDITITMLISNKSKKIHKCVGDAYI